MSEFTTTADIVMKAQEKTKGYLDQINRAREHFCLAKTDLSSKEADGKMKSIFHPYLEKKYIGKVRDVYQTKTEMVLVATDRQSAFDRHLSNVPFKGQILSQISNYWFQQTKEIVPNHVIAHPHPNVTIGKKCHVFPIEFVMRCYMTGSTGTSIWKNYEKGMREYCGHQLPEGMKKNMKLPEILLTPTTKSDIHDELISKTEIIARGFMTEQEWDTCESYAMKLFTYGSKLALSRGLILVDTKFEFGKDLLTNEIMVIDEIMTPDSSRYWIADTYVDRIAKGLEPENIDKEFLRLWFSANCDPYHDEVIPDAPHELVNELSRRYIMLYELIVGEDFQFPNMQKSINDSIIESILSSNITT